MTECTALTQHPGAPESIDYFIEDFFKLNQEPTEIWQHSSTQPPPSSSPVPSHYHQQSNQKDLLLKHFNNSSSKTRLNSYEDSLSSPESVFSIRSRVSSGEDDLELFWRESSNPIKPLEPLEEEPQAIQTQQSLNPSTIPNTDSDYDPSLTELNAILDENPRMEFCPQQHTPTVQQQIQQEASTPNTVEWTYLEPVQPSSTYTLPSTNNIEEVMVPITTASSGFMKHEFATWEVNGATYIHESPSVLVQPVWPHPQMQPPHHANQQILNIEVLEHINNPRKPLKKIPGLKHVKKFKKEPESDIPRLCHVCGEQAGKHSYYGGQVCPSCRAFFRRSVQSKYSDIYKCTKGGRCQITLKTRKNCQFCRFQACEKAGMKRSWVLADGEVKSKKVASGGCVPSSNKVTSTTNPSAMPSSSSSNTNIMCSILSPQDEGKIRKCIEKMQLIKQQTEDLNPQVMHEFTELVKKRHCQLSKSSCCAMKKVLDQRARLFALNVPEFISLSSNDQMILQEENGGPLIELRIATFFQTDFKARQQLGMILGPSDVLRITSSLAGMGNDSLDNQHLEYEQFFVMQAADEDNKDQISSDHSTKLLRVMAEHKSLLQKISKWVDDETTFCLMNLILLFNSSEIRNNLEAPNEVERHQIYYTELLYRYLLSKYPKSKARSKLAEGICIVSHCRELHQLAILRCSMNRKVSESTNSSSGSGGEDN